MNTHNLSKFLCALLLAVGLVLGGPASSQAQIPGIDEPVEALKDASMGIVEGCNYMEYLQQAKNLQEAYQLIQNLGWNPEHAFSLPVTDYVSLLPKILSTKSTNETAEAESKGLLYTLEQVCNTATQSDELQRVRDIVEDGRINIDEVVGAFTDVEDFGVEFDDGRPRLTGDFTDVYNDLLKPSTGNPAQDSTSRMVARSVEATIETTDSLRNALSEYETQVEELHKDLQLLAEPADSADGEGEGSSEGEASAEDGSGGAWTCPEGYPDPSETDLPTNEEGVPICGPVGPEKSTQVLAKIELLIAEMQGHRNAIDTRSLELGAVGLAQSNYQQKNIRAITNRSLSQSMW